MNDTDRNGAGLDGGSKHDGPFQKHWLYYRVMKLAILLAAAALAARLMGYW